VKDSIDEIGALAHVHESQAAALFVTGIYAADVEAYPIVFHFEDESIIFAAQPYPDMRRFGVLASVFYCLLSTF
jgi:hypothetical protein